MRGWQIDQGIEQLGGHSSGGLDDSFVQVASDCLFPIVAAGECVCFADEVPKPWQICMLAIRGDSFGRLKIFLGFYDRGDQHLDLFGDDQPQRIAVFAAINPLEAYVVAERDLARLRPAVYVGTQNRLREVAAGVSVMAEQWQAISEALAF